MVSSTEIRDAHKKIAAVIPFSHPATVWYFSKIEPEECIMPEQDTWSCMFSHVPRLFYGDAICFSAGRTGCAGASCYLGFSHPAKDAGYYLAEKEKFKKSKELGDAFYDKLKAPPALQRYVLWQKLENITDGCQVEVINLWIQADGLSGLVGLANYDRTTSDNVVIPSSSGCQSLWTLPFQQRNAADAKCIVGCTDPVVRHYLPKDVLSFSMIAERFLEMADNVAGSFLKREKWSAILKK